jgi:hypothetical protein
MTQVSDEAIIYQLEKVDSGGAVMELFEDRIYYLAKEWGYEIDEDTDEIVLPDGRRAGLAFTAYIDTPDDLKEKQDDDG